VVSVPVPVGLVNFNRPEAATRPASGGARPFNSRSGGGRRGGPGCQRGGFDVDGAWWGPEDSTLAPTARRCGAARGQGSRQLRATCRKAHQNAGSPSPGTEARAARVHVSFFLCRYVDAYSFGFGFSRFSTGIIAAGVGGIVYFF
jgi:hypothetical protein